MLTTPAGFIAGPDCRLSSQAQLGSREQIVAALQAAAQRREQDLAKAREQLQDARAQLQQADEAHSQALAAQLQVSFECVHSPQPWSQSWLCMSNLLQTTTCSPQRGLLDV